MPRKDHGHKNNPPKTREGEKCYANNKTEKENLLSVSDEERGITQSEGKRKMQGTRLPSCQHYPLTRGRDFSVCIADR